MTSFEDDLACTLTVWCAGASTAVPGANIKRLSLELAAYGFRGEVAFWVRADDAGNALHQSLIGDAPIELELGVARARYLGTPPPPLAVRGAVLARRFVELTTDDITGRPVRFRRYTMALADPACAAWSLHHPTAVYVDKSLADVVRAQLVGEMTLDVAWPELQQKRALMTSSRGWRRRARATSPSTTPAGGITSPTRRRGSRSRRRSIARPSPSSRSCCPSRCATSSASSTRGPAWTRSPRSTCPRRGRR